MTLKDVKTAATVVRVFTGLALVALGESILGKPAHHCTGLKKKRGFGKKSRAIRLAPARKMRPLNRARITARMPSKAARPTPPPVPAQAPTAAAVAHA